MAISVPRAGIAVPSESMLLACDSWVYRLIPFHISLAAMKSCTDGKNQTHTSEIISTRIPDYRQERRRLHRLTRSLTVTASWRLRSTSAGGGPVTGVQYPFEHPGECHEQDDGRTQDPPRVHGILPQRLLRFQRRPGDLRHQVGGLTVPVGDLALRSAVAPALSLGWRDRYRLNARCGCRTGFRTAGVAGASRARDFRIAFSTAGADR